MKNNRITSKDRLAKKIIGSIGFIVSVWIENSEETFPPFFSVGVPRIGEVVRLDDLSREFRVESVEYVVMKDVDAGYSCFYVDCICTETSTTPDAPSA